MESPSNFFVREHHEEYFKRAIKTDVIWSDKHSENYADFFTIELDSSQCILYR